MPKDTVERAIKKATDKDAGDYKEIVYEGYGPFGIAIVVEAATDNNTRTVANVRSYFNKHGGTLGTQGSLSFLFEHKSVFKIFILLKLFEEFLKLYTLFGGYLFKVVRYAFKFCTYDFEACRGTCRSVGNIHALH